MKLQQFISWVLIITATVPLFAQEPADTILQLKEITLTAIQLRKHPVGTLTQKWKTDDLTNNGLSNIANLLNQDNTTFVKSYGPGSLATSSIRGGSAGHTLVLWNGLPVQSPMLGLLDLSLLPIMAFENIQLQKGGSSAMWGSGAIGGVLSMDNQAEFTTALKANIGLQSGSFRLQQQQLKLSYGNLKFQAVTKVINHQADNDFLFSINADLPEQRQSHAASSKQLIIQTLYYKPTDRDLLSLHFWWQKAYREIPPTLTQSNSDATQDDLSNRLAISWKRNLAKAIIKAKAGYFEEDLNYYDPTIRLSSLSNFKSVLTDLETQWQWKANQYFSTGITNYFTLAEADGYNELIRENRSALYVSHRIGLNKIKIQSSLRQALVNDYFAPLIPMFGVDYQITKAWVLKAKASRNFRLPTLNDRYWLPGGNPELKAENGWSQEITILSQKQNYVWHWHYQITGFNRNILDWILWTPVEGQVFWTAKNIAKVWSRGIENMLKVKYVNRLLELNFSIGYDYIRSTNQIALRQPRIAKGEQLLYTPSHQAFAKLGMNWKRWNLYYQHQFIGRTQGINQALPSYHLGYFNLNYKIKRQVIGGSAFFKINNIWNANYQVIERRPMPGIHFLAGFNLSIDSILKKEKPI